VIEKSKNEFLIRFVQFPVFVSHVL